MKGKDKKKKEYSKIIFQTIDSARAKNQCWKYQRFTPLGCKEKGIRKLEFEARII